MEYPVTSPTQSLPRGIRNNNPGNLRQAMGPDLRTQIVDGFAHFATLQQGVCSFFWLLHSYYRIQGIRTLPDFVSRYAPATENDVALYTRFIAQRLGLNPLSLKTQDLHLDRTWRAIDFARAIFAMECGNAPVAMPYLGEWVPPLIMVNAINATGKWEVM